MQLSTPPKQTAGIDVAVAVLFFNRPDMLRRLFERLRQVRPARLLLYQDGPRNQADTEKMEQCRAIVADDQIDWECTVHRNYQTVNRGVDPSSYLCVKWAFSLYDKCIKVEDDDLPSCSFFPFCKEMLDRYEHDQRIGIVSGMNFDETTPDVPYDYFFTTAFSINGWASWRRVIDQWDDGSYAFLQDEFNIHQAEQLLREHRDKTRFVDVCHRHKAAGKAFYESIFRATLVFGSMLSIVPQVNLVQNAGASNEGAHYSGSNDLLPRGIRRVFEMQAFELQFPLRHPPYIIENVEYKQRFFRTMAWGHPWIKAGRSLEELWLNLRKGNLGRIRSALVQRVKRTFSRH